MSADIYRLPKLEDFVLAVTPTQNRQDYLERQYTIFLEGYRDARAADPSLPRMGWVIFDESAEPSEFFANLEDPDVVYLHVPRRDDLSSVPEEYRDIVESNLYSERDVAERIGWIQENVCNRVKPLLNYAVPSIGEMRNIAIDVGVEHFGLQGKDFHVFTKDDDDYSSPELLKDMRNSLKGAVFAKPARIVIYQKPMNAWYEYDINRQDEEALCVYNGETKKVDRYIVWNDPEETTPSEYGHLEMLGTLFSYRYSAWKAISQERQAAGQKPGGFEPTSWREDHLFARAVFEKYGLDAVTVVDNEPHHFGRLVERNTAKTICHGDVDPATLPKATRGGLHFLSLAQEFEKSADPVKDVREVFARNAKTGWRGEALRPDQQHKIGVYAQPEPAHAVG